MASGLHFQFTTKDANRLLLFLVLFELCLVFIFMIDILLAKPDSLHKLFDLDGEASIPAWFSSVQLFLIGILFLFSGGWPLRHQIVAPRFLLLVGIGFVFLSMDEAAAFHEYITVTLRHIEWLPRFNEKYGIWIPVYLSIAVIMATIGNKTIKSMQKIYPRQSLIISFGLIVLFAGAIGMEIISYLYLRGEGKSLLYKALYVAEVTIEEFFEMSGASIILYGTLLCALREGITPRN